MSIEDQIRVKLQDEFQPTLLKVLDESAMHGASSSHFRVLVVSDIFTGKGALQRHQQVYKTIGVDIMQKIHAFSQQTFTPEEWQKSKQEQTSPPCHKNHDSEES